MAVSDYSTTPSANTTISGINVGEGCAPGNINNAIRQLMADTRGFYNDVRVPAIMSIAGLTTSANQMIYTTGANTYATTALTAAGRALLDDADTAAQRTTLGLGALATLDSIVGVGATTVATGADYNDSTLPGGLYFMSPTATGRPVDEYCALVQIRGDSLSWAQIAMVYNSKRLFVRKATDASWTEIARVSDVLGVGQTWQNVLASRAVSTSYQNTTGKPIAVSVGGIEGTSFNGRNFEVSADNSTWQPVGRVGGNNNTFSSVSIIVPNNWYYRLNGSMGTLSYWAELR